MIKQWLYNVICAYLQRFNGQFLRIFVLATLNRDYFVQIMETILSGDLLNPLKAKYGEILRHKASTGDTTVDQIIVIQCHLGTYSRI